MQRRRWAKAKGQATVELAVLMIVIVPVFLYVLFSDELLRHQLDLQETVVSSAWDYAFLNYETKGSAAAATAGSIFGGAGGVVGGLVGGGASQFSGKLDSHHRREYENHSSINPGQGTQTKSKKADSHFTGPRWQENISCQMTKSDDVAFQDSRGMASKFRNTFQEGGKVTCSARKDVVNYFLMTRFMHEWSKKELSSKKTSAKGSEGDDSSRWPLAKQSFSIVTDTWALTQEEERDPGYLPGSLRVSGALSGFGDFVDVCTVRTLDGDRFYERMFTIFCEGEKRKDAVAEAVKIIKAANDAEYLQSHLKQDFLGVAGIGIGGDNTGTPTLAFFPDKKDGKARKNLGFNSSPWKDGGGDAYEKAHQERKNSYLGKELN